MTIETAMKRRAPASSSGAALLLLLSACSEEPRGPLGITELDTPAGELSGPSHLSTAPDGTVVLNWLESTTGEAMALKYTTLPAGSET